MKKPNRNIKHDEKIAKCEEFIKNFEDYDLGEVGSAYEHYGRRKYMIRLVSVP